MERKTHRESWKGEESVKERIVLPEDNVVPFLEQAYTVEQAEADLRAKVGVPSIHRLAIISCCHDYLVAAGLSAGCRPGTRS